MFHHHEDYQPFVFTGCYESLIKEMLDNGFESCINVAYPLPIYIA